MTFPTTSSWPEDWGINPDAFKSTSEMMSAVIAKFSEVKQQFHQTVQQHLSELPNLLTLMVDNSWYPFDIPLADSRVLESRAIAGDFPAIQRYLIDYFRSNAADIEQQVCNIYPDRSDIVAAAFSAYREGRYVLAIPVLLAQADGISHSLLSKHFFRSRESITEAQQLLQGGQLSDYARLLLDPLVQRGTIRVHTSELSGITDYFNRHAVMHGIDHNYGTEKNALKCISLLAYLLLVQLVKD